MRIVALCLLLLPWALQAEDWKVVGDEQFAPYSFVTVENDQPRGLDVELVEAGLVGAVGLGYPRCIQVGAAFIEA